MSKLEINFQEQKLPIIKQIVSVLGGKTRIEILQLINQGKDYTTTKLAKKIGCTVGNLTQQINKLERAGLVLRKTGKTVGTHTKIIKPVYDKIEIIF